MSIILEIRDFVSDAAYTGFGEQVANGGRRKVFEWRTDLVQYDSGKEQRNQILEQPIRHFWINWQWLNEAARNKLVELFHRARGRYSTFLYEDNLDYACDYTDWEYTTAGGETTTQLQKTYYKGETEEWTENKTRIQPSSVYKPTIKVNGAEKEEGTDFTLDDETGIITWTGYSVQANDVITANYQFYFPVRFDFDEYTDINHMIDYWSVQDLHLVEVI